MNAMKTWLSFLSVLSAGILAAGAALAMTEFTGSVIDGKPVIAKLDVQSLESARLHRFFFAAGENGVGQSWYVPVMVAKGAGEGPRLLLNAAVHGDELNGIALIQRVFASLDIAALHGTLIAVPGGQYPRYAEPQPLPPFGHGRRHGREPQPLHAG